jgi:hypothetical protein
VNTVLLDRRRFASRQHIMMMNHHYHGSRPNNTTSCTPTTMTASSTNRPVQQLHGQRQRTVVAPRAPPHGDGASKQVLKKAMNKADTKQLVATPTALLAVQPHRPETEPQLESEPRASQQRIRRTRRRRNARNNTKDMETAVVIASLMSSECSLADGDNDSLSSDQHSRSSRILKKMLVNGTSASTKASDGDVGDDDEDEDDYQPRRHHHKQHEGTPAAARTRQTFISSGSGTRLATVEEQPASPHHADTSTYYSVTNKIKNAVVLSSCTQRISASQKHQHLLNEPVYKESQYQKRRISSTVSRRASSSSSNTSKRSDNDTDDARSKAGSRISKAESKSSSKSDTNSKGGSKSKAESNNSRSSSKRRPSSYTSASAVPAPSSPSTCTTATASSTPFKASAPTTSRVVLSYSTPNKSSKKSSAIGSENYHSAAIMTPDVTDDSKMDMDMDVNIVMALKDKQLQLRWAQESGNVSERMYQMGLKHNVLQRELAGSRDMTHKLHTMLGNSRGGSGKDNHAHDHTNNHHENHLEEKTRRLLEQELRDLKQAHKALQAEQLLASTPSVANAAIPTERPVVDDIDENKHEHERDETGAQAEEDESTGAVQNHEDVAILKSLHRRQLKVWNKERKALRRDVFELKSVILEQAKSAKNFQLLHKREIFALLEEIEWLQHEHQFRIQEVEATACEMQHHNNVHTNQGGQQGSVTGGGSRLMTSLDRMNLTSMSNPLINLSIRRGLLKLSDTEHESKSTKKKKKSKRLRHVLEPSPAHALVSAPSMDENDDTVVMSNSNNCSQHRRRCSDGDISYTSTSLPFPTKVSKQGGGGGGGGGILQDSNMNSLNFSSVFYHESENKDNGNEEEHELLASLSLSLSEEEPERRRQEIILERTRRNEETLRVLATNICEETSHAPAVLDKKEGSRSARQGQKHSSRERNSSIPKDNDIVTTEGSARDPHPQARAPDSSSRNNGTGGTPSMAARDAAQSLLDRYARHSKFKTERSSLIEKRTRGIRQRRQQLRQQYTASSVSSIEASQDRNGEGHNNEQEQGGICGQGDRGEQLAALLHVQTNMNDECDDDDEEQECMLGTKTERSTSAWSGRGHGDGSTNTYTTATNSSLHSTALGTGAGIGTDVTRAASPFPSSSSFNTTMSDWNKFCLSHSMDTGNHDGEQHQLSGDQNENDDTDWKETLFSNE